MLCRMSSILVMTFPKKEGEKYMQTNVETLNGEDVNEETNSEVREIMFEEVEEWS